MIFTVNAVGVSVLTALSYVTRFADFSRLAIFMFFTFSTLFVSAKRIGVRAILRHYRKLGYNQKHVIVVGNGHFAQQYIEDIQKHPHLGFTVDGYVSRVQRPELGRRTLALMKIWRICRRARSGDDESDCSAGAWMRGNL